MTERPTTRDRVLCFLVAAGDQFGPPALGDFARALGLSKTRVRQCVEELIASGLATRGPVPEGFSSVHGTLRATHAGRRAAWGWMIPIYPVTNYRRLDI